MKAVTFTVFFLCLTNSVLSKVFFFFFIKLIIQSGLIDNRAALCSS